MPNKYSSIRITFFLLLLFCCHSTYAQVSEEGLLRRVKNAPNDSLRIDAMNLLAQHYYHNRNERAGDSIVEKQIMLAEESRNTNLVIKALFYNPRYAISKTSSKISYTNYEYITRALNYAKANNLNDFVSLAYSNLAVYYIEQGNIEEAFKNANLGYATAQNSANDSVIVVCALQLGKVYEKKSEVLMAFKTFSNALDVATSKENPYLLSAVYKSFSDLYKKLKKEEIAKSYVFKSLALNKQSGSVEGQLEDYLSLAKLYSYSIAKEYLRRAEKIADSINNKEYKIEAQKILFSYMTLEERPETTINYLYTHHDLVASYESNGPQYLSWMIAEVYLYGKMPDSSILHFRKAEQSFANSYDVDTKKNFFTEYADCYAALGLTQDAINNYRIALDASSVIHDYKSMVYISSRLKDLYQQKDDYKQAFFYSNQYLTYQDTVAILGKENDLAFLEIENENKRRLREAELAKQEEDRRHNLQYMGISIIVATAFILLLTLGMFKVSKYTIEILGFFAFIFFFEFILMLLEKVIHHITHGEPWKIWLIKIGILSIIFPLHHYIEGKVTHYLLSRKLIEVRSRFSIKNVVSFFRNKIKKPKPGSEDTLSSTPATPVV